MASRYHLRVTDRAILAFMQQRYRIMLRIVVFDEANTVKLRLEREAHG